MPVGPERVEEPLHIGRELGLEAHLCLGDAVPEADAPSVEGLPLDEGLLARLRRLPLEIRKKDPLFPPVQPIAGDGQPDLGHVDPDLVGSARQQFAFQKRDAWCA